MVWGIILKTGIRTAKRACFRVQGLGIRDRYQIGRESVLLAMTSLISVYHCSDDQSCVAMIVQNTKMPRTDGSPQVPTASPSYPIPLRFTSDIGPDDEREEVFLKRYINPMPILFFFLLFGVSFFTIKV